MNLSTNVPWIIWYMLNYVDIFWYDMIVLNIFEPAWQHAAPFARSFGWRNFTSCPGECRRMSQKAAIWNILEHLSSFLVFILESFRFKMMRSLYSFPAGKCSRCSLGGSHACRCSRWALREQLRSWCLMQESPTIIHIIPYHIISYHIILHDMACYVHVLHRICIE